VADIIQIRRDTAANWTSVNSTLAQGEIGLETDTGKLKVGDGLAAWTSLGYYTLGTVGYVTETDSTFVGSITEAIYNNTGTTPVLDPANGTIQTWTLTGNSTPTSALTAGQSITLMVEDGTGFTVTWPSVAWVNNAGAAPTLATSGYTTIALWNVVGTLYGALVGDGS